MNSSLIEVVFQKSNESIDKKNDTDDVTTDEKIEEKKTITILSFNRNHCHDQMNTRTSEREKEKKITRRGMDDWRFLIPLISSRFA